MAQATKKKVVEKKQDKLVSLKTATPAKAVPAELTRGKDELTPAHVLTWINENAGGNKYNVEVVPVDSVDQQAEKPIPFGYSGKANGPRATFHNWHVRGVDGDRRLGKILESCREVDKSHSQNKMVCTMALLNGGYGRNSNTWGMPFIKLRAVQP